MNNFQDRLQKLVNKLAGGKYTVFAKSCGIPHSTFQNYMNGRMPHSDHLLRIHDKYGVDLNWLLSGRGEPYLSSTAVKENSGDKETRDTQERSPKNSEISDAEIIEQFSDKRSARDLVLHLAELEQINTEAFNKVGPYIKGLLDGLRIKPTQCCRYTGPDRRTAERRVKDSPGKFKGSKDQRSGKDRRVAAHG